MQPMLKMTAKFADIVNFDGMGIAAEQIRDFAPRLTFGCGVSSLAHLAINLLPVDDGTELALQEREHLLAFYVMSRGNNSGRIRNLPGFRDPAVQYRVSAAERSNLAGGVRKLALALLEAGAESVYTGLPEMPVIQSHADISKLSRFLDPRSANLMAIHLMSSCPMGENKKNNSGRFLWTGARA